MSNLREIPSAHDELLAARCDIHPEVVLWLTKLNVKLDSTEFFKIRVNALFVSSIYFPGNLGLIFVTKINESLMVFLKLFIRLPVVLSSSPLKILEGFCCGIHSNRKHAIRNDLICFIEKCLFCLYDGRKTDRIWNYVFQRGATFNGSDWPWQTVFGENICYKKTKILT